jgi:hypothetical protein
MYDLHYLKVEQVDDSKIVFNYVLNNKYSGVSVNYLFPDNVVRPLVIDTDYISYNGTSINLDVDQNIKTLFSKIDNLYVEYMKKKLVNDKHKKLYKLLAHTMVNDNLSANIYHPKFKFNTKDKKYTSSIIKYLSKSAIDKQKLLNNSVQKHEVLTNFTMDDYLNFTRDITKLHSKFNCYQMKLIIHFKGHYVDTTKDTTKEPFKGLNVNFCGINVYVDKMEIKHDKSYINSVIDKNKCVMDSTVINENVYI